MNTWTHTAELLAALIRHGDDAGKAKAIHEVNRMAEELDRLSEAPMAEDVALDERINSLFEDTLAARLYTAEQLRFISDGIPEGYDTVLSYTAKNMPEALPFDADVPDCTQRDGFWLKHRCHERGIKPVKVPAPEALQAWDIHEVNAYPTELVRERLGVE